MSTATRTRRIACECETVPTGRPDRRDRFAEGEARIPNPVCPRHAILDDMAPAEYGDAADMLDMYGVAYDYTAGEWVEADGIDEETGDPIRDEDAA